MLGVPFRSRKPPVTGTVDPQVVAFIHQAFEAQGLFRHLGAQVGAIAPGRLEMSLDYRPELSQQNGFFHGGAIGFLVDNATAGAAGTVIGPGNAILTAEYKVNMLAPATRGRLIARAEVVKAGRTLITIEARVFVQPSEGPEKLVAIGLATMAVVPAEKVA